MSVNREHKELMDYVIKEVGGKIFSTAIGLVIGLFLIDLYTKYYKTPPTCTIETMRGTVEYGTSCRQSYGTLECKEKTYGMYLSYACKKGEK